VIRPFINPNALWSPRGAVSTTWRETPLVCRIKNHGASKWHYWHVFDKWTWIFLIIALCIFFPAMMFIVFALMFAIIMAGGAGS